MISIPFHYTCSAVVMCFPIPFQLCFDIYLSSSHLTFGRLLVNTLHHVLKVFHSNHSKLEDGNDDISAEEEVKWVCIIYRG